MGLEPALLVFSVKPNFRFLTTNRYKDKTFHVTLLIVIMQRWFHLISQKGGASQSFCLYFLSMYGPNSDIY